MKRLTTLLGVLGLLGGCAGSGGSSPWLIDRGDAAPRACAPLSQDQELALNLAQETADEGRLHAALANLERLPNSLPEARLRKARILRSLNRPEAKDLYASLVDTCLKAQGEHGLGQLASAEKRYDEALKHLRLAVSLAPTSDTMRNDLGVVYMNLGRLEEARFELLTSQELNQAEKRPALNLLTLLIYQDNLKQASALVTRMGFSANQFRAAELRAQALRRELGGKEGAPMAVAPVVPAVANPAVAPASSRPVQPATPGAATGVASQPAMTGIPAAPLSNRATATPVSVQAVQMVPGRLVVPDDGGVVRVEPASSGRGEAIVPISGY
ncbi:hypothetical protein DNK34_13340 [Pseudomonas dryadis]|uniref:Flp pilus assembly protein TadD, contains TPR repeats n=1 Tax=Phytopseudomonas dryadis TaxID=2487520 RepID=A0ABY1Z9E1_9GAMM|nr:MULTISPECIES: tetratricopeptide repeat protein [Pseudomonas]TBV05034.1 hypothetical protein DNK34_13340 [Pseudomonas dryadis]TBV16437.1 hypothetical protein DNK41_15195 [Pseudomonas sp. FRB 230]